MNKLKFEYDNHIHLLDGFYDPSTHNYYKITNINIEFNSSNLIISQIPISDKRLKLLLYKHVEKDFSLNKYDKRINYPEKFEPAQIGQCLIEITCDILNENKQRYKLKEFYYETIQNEQKLNKYKHKLFELETPFETSFKTNSEMQVFSGGSQTPLIKDIHVDMCDNVFREKPKQVVDIYSEPMTRELFDILANVCKNKLEIDIKPEEFIYIANVTGARFYYQKHKGILTFDEFKVYYDDLFNIIDNVAKLGGFVTHPDFINMYEFNFKKETFENNTWKSRIMANHLINHKYAHNGIGKDEFHEIIDMIMLINLEDSSDMWSGLHFIHSFAHIYDDIYMISDNSYRFQTQIQTLNEIKKDMFEPNLNQYDCLRKKINSHRSDFLIKDGNKFVQPYQIKPEALVDKQRQYSSNWFSPTFPTFDEQIRGINSIKTGETYKMINEDIV